MGVGQDDEKDRGGMEAEKVCKERACEGEAQGWVRQRAVGLVRKR